MATTDTPARVAAAAAKVKTVGQARAALGVVADVLRIAYAHAGDVSSMGGAAEAATSRLDVVNNYAQRIYGALPAEGDQAAAISPLQAAQVGLVIGQAQRALKDIDEAVEGTAWNLVDLLTQAIAAAAKLAGQAIQGATNAAAGGLFAFLRAAWPTVLIAAVVVLGLLWLRGRVARKVLG